MAPAQTVPAAGRATLGRRGVDGALRLLLRCPGPPFERRQVDATQIATYTAEEMALHLIIEEAKGTAGDGSLDTEL